MLTHTSRARHPAGRSWAWSVVIFPDYGALSQPLLEKCFKPNLARSTHERAAFHTPEIPRKPVFPRSGMDDAERRANICDLALTDRFVFVPLENSVLAHGA